MRRYGYYSDTRMYTDTFEDTWAGQDYERRAPQPPPAPRPPAPPDLELAAAVAAWIAAGTDATARRAAARIDHDPGDEDRT